MTCLHGFASVVVSVLLAGAGVQSAGARLPAIGEHPWMGYFAGFSNRHCKFGITSEGKMILRTMGDDREPIGRKFDVAIAVAIEEVLPSGKVVVKKIVSQALESEQKPTTDLEKVTVRGKVTGDAAFELVIDRWRGKVLLGGRMLDRGNLTDNPVRFSIRARFSKAYPYDSPKTAKEKKDFQKRVRKDRIDLRRTDKKRVKLALNQNVVASSNEISGSGIALAKVDIDSFRGRKFEFDASEGSAITLWNGEGGALHEGFTMVWMPDPEKDPGGKARFGILLR